jgi:hypothetical protein
MPLRAGRLGLATVPKLSTRNGLWDATLSHPGPDLDGVRRAESRVVGGVGPDRGLVESAWLGRLADEHVRLPIDKGANEGVKVTSLVAGMAAGADSIDDMALLRRDGPGLRARLRPLHVGVVPADVHLRPRPPTRRGGLEVPARVGRADPSARHRRRSRPGSGEYALLDVDDTIIEVHGHGKRAVFGYPGSAGSTRCWPPRPPPRARR